MEDLLKDGVFDVDRCAKMIMIQAYIDIQENVYINIKGKPERVK